MLVIAAGATGLSSTLICAICAANHNNLFRQMTGSGMRGNLGSTVDYKKVSSFPG
jgi:hypothetical protein